MKLFVRPALSVLALFCLICSTSAAMNMNPEPAPVKLKGKMGLQLYSLRAQFAQDVPGTLDRVRGFGIEYVELAGTYGMEPAKFRELLESKKLKAVASHFPYERFRDDPEAVARDAKALGVEYAGVAWISRPGAFDEKVAREAIAVFNRAGEVLSKHGLKFFYHPHGYEFVPHGDGTLFDLMMAETKPEHVYYEMDTFWIVHPGQDPVKLFERYGSRFQLMHLKDMKKGTPTPVHTGGAPPDETEVPVGSGQIDFRAVLKAAREAGVQHYFVEDETRDPFATVPVTTKWLESVKF